MSRRGGLGSLAAFAGGVLAGVAVENLVYRGAFRRDDPDEGARFGSPDAEHVWVTSFDGTRLHARVLGPPDAPAVVFVHGITLTHVVWHYQLRDLAADARFRLVAYDARGHGLSGPARGPDGTTPFNGETLARDLHAVMHQTEATPAVVVGHSLGGMTIQSLLEFKDEFPAEFGSTIRGLVLLNTSFTAELGGWAGRSRWRRIRGRARRAADWFAEHPGLLRPLRDPASDVAMLFARLGFGANPSAAHVALTSKLVGAVDLETLAAAVDLATFDTHASLADIDVPVVVVAGDRDLLTPVWLSEEMAERIPDADLVVFHGAGHMGMLERHDDFSALLTKFCERVLSSATADAERRPRKRSRP